VPAEAGLVAYVDVQHLMASELRQRVAGLLPFEAEVRRELADRTGIDLERDVTSVVAAMVPTQGDERPSFGVLLLANGQFDADRIENLMREAGARIEEYKGSRLVVAGRESDTSDRFSLAFIGSDLVAAGSRGLVRGVIDRHNGDGTAIAANNRLMGQIRSVRAKNVWAAGSFQALNSRASLPLNLSAQLPAFDSFSAGADISGGVRGSVQVDASDEAAANSFKEVVRGFLALAHLQGTSQPTVKQFLDSFVLGGSGRTVTLSFNAPAEFFNLTGAPRISRPPSIRDRRSIPPDARSSQ
jgi:hypothetical protein